MPAAVAPARPIFCRTAAQRPQGRRQTGSRRGLDGDVIQIKSLDREANRFKELPQGRVLLQRSERRLPYSISAVANFMTAFSATDIPSDSAAAPGAGTGVGRYSGIE